MNKWKNLLVLKERMGKNDTWTFYKELGILQALG